MIEVEFEPSQVRLFFQCDIETYQRWVDTGLLPKGKVASHIVQGLQQLIEENKRENIVIDEAAKLLSRHKATLLNWESRGIIRRAVDHRLGIYFKKQEIERIGAYPKRHSTSLQCRKCHKHTPNVNIAFGYCEKCYMGTKYKAALKQYSEGKTLEQIGNVYGVTRERARQLIKKALTIEENFSNKPSVTTWERVKIEHKQEEHKNRKWHQDISDNYDDILDAARTYQSLREFMKNFNIPMSSKNVLQSDFPEIYSAVKPRWSMKYDSCANCETVRVPHKIYGYCRNCYYKSDKFKAIQRRSRLRTEKIRRDGKD